MMAAALDVDYLIIGGGAAGLGFADVIVQETDSTVAIVDRRDSPGGHWNDAYPFVRLHHPSHYYGVHSTPLGDLSRVGDGFNSGLLHMASGADIASYYQAVLRTKLLPTGRVHYLPMCDYDRQGMATNSLSGSKRQIHTRKRTVDATLSGTTVPSRHTRNFSVAAGVACIPLNDLPKVAAPPAGGYTVIGSGKTGMDACLWLLNRGVAPDVIRWVMPRDAWWIDRANAQFTSDFFEATVTSIAVQMEALGAATSIENLFQRLESCGALLRLDPTVAPTMFHGATISKPELEALRRIKNVVRLGRVQAIEPERLALAGGTIPAHPETLYVDCSAAGFAVARPVKVFDGDTINLQMLKSFQPTFSAALIAHIETSFTDDAVKNELCTPVAPPRHATDWLPMMAVTLMNQGRWSQHPELMAWILGCRLDPLTALMRNVAPDDTVRLALLQRSRQAIKPAAANLQKLMTMLPRPPR